MGAKNPSIADYKPLSERVYCHRIGKTRLSGNPPLPANWSLD
ncbi:hypothetical protein MC7420_6363 [Coleofasciculus chthonoplastes PCC 7420]|uniref:Uncharacterized protein n=1 Tax=Coleofasciculus chthonoplastes PCC 7420 TaxID=118168 RepID=B4VQT0_9CYAN|nr:hypothetical protein MC7420_6363 [Coleofasciculus chthonoplastes PCC 7420]